MASDTDPVEALAWDYSKDERADLLRKMSDASTAFYRQATRIGVHTFIEFTGLMNEWIGLCHQAEEEGVEWVFASAHNGRPLPMKAHQAIYLAEKLECIYGPALQSNPELARRFVDALLGPRYELREVGT